jgi:hypothetical protein
MLPHHNPQASLVENQADSLLRDLPAGLVANHHQNHHRSLRSNPVRGQASSRLPRLAVILRERLLQNPPRNQPDSHLANQLASQHPDHPRSQQIVPVRGRALSRLRNRVVVPPRLRRRNQRHILVLNHPPNLADNQLRSLHRSQRVNRAPDQVCSLPLGLAIVRRTLPRRNQLRTPAGNHLADRAVNQRPLRPRSQHGSLAPSLPHSLHQNQVVARPGFRRPNLLLNRLHSRLTNLLDSQHAGLRPNLLATQVQDRAPSQRDNRAVAPRLSPPLNHRCDRLLNPPGNPVPGLLLSQLRNRAATRRGFPPHSHQPNQLHNRAPTRHANLPPSRPRNRRASQLLVQRANLLRNLLRTQLLSQQILPLLSLLPNRQCSPVDSRLRNRRRNRRAGLRHNPVVSRQRSPVVARPKLLLLNLHGSRVFSRQANPAGSPRQFRPRNQVRVQRVSQLVSRLRSLADLRPSGPHDNRVLSLRLLRRGNLRRFRQASRRSLRPLNRQGALPRLQRLSRPGHQVPSRLCLLVVSQALTPLRNPQCIPLLNQHRFRRRTQVVFQLRSQLGAQRLLLPYNRRQFRVRNHQICPVPFLPCCLRDSRHPLPLGGPPRSPVWFPQRNRAQCRQVSRRHSRLRFHQRSQRRFLPTV